MTYHTPYKNIQKLKAKGLFTLCNSFSIYKEEGTAQMVRWRSNERKRALTVQMEYITAFFSISLLFIAICLCDSMLYSALLTSVYVLSL